MRILFLTNSMNVGGGVEKCIFQLTQLFKNQHEVFVGSSGGDYVKELDAMGIKHFSIIDPKVKLPGAIVKNIFEIRDFIKENQIEIVHSHHRMTSFYLKLLKWITPVNAIHTSHLYTEDKKVLTYLTLKGLPTISVSRGVKNGLVKNYGLREKEVEVIYNTIDLGKATGESDQELLERKKKKDLIVGVVSRLEPVKGIEILLEAVKELIPCNKNIKFYIIGSGSLESKLKSMVEKEGLQYYVTFLGKRTNIKDFLEQFDVLVQSSYREGLPLAVIEAISSGVPVIGTNIPGTNEVVIDHYNGLLVEAGDSTAIKESILYLYDNKHLLLEMSENGMNFFQENFNKKAYFQNHLDYYQKTLHK